MSWRKKITKNTHIKLQQHRKKKNQNKTNSLSDMKYHIIKKAMNPEFGCFNCELSDMTSLVWHRDTAAKTESRLAYFKYAFLSLQDLPSQTLSAGSLDPQEEGEDDVPTKKWQETIKVYLFLPVTYAKRGTTSIGKKKKKLFVPTDKTYSLLHWPCHE